MARFTWSCNASTNVITFNGASSTYETSYAWKFEYSTGFWARTGAHPQVNYTGYPGGWTAQLTVKGSGGRTSSIVKLVHCP